MEPGLTQQSDAMKRTEGNSWMDVSVALYQGVVHWPGDPELCTELAKSLEGGDACNVTKLTTGVHIGTHMDAPRHFIPNGLGIDRLPLDAVMGACRVIQIQDNEAVRPAELEHQALKPGERILFKTRNSLRGWTSSNFLEDFVYVSKEAAQFLVERKVQTVGVDYLSVGGFHKDGPETHRILLGATVWVIEGLDLSKVEPGNYEMVCLPLKLVDSDGAPARALLRPI